MPGFVPRDLRKFVDKLKNTEIDKNSISWADIEIVLKEIKPTLKNSFQSTFVQEQISTNPNEIQTVAGCHELIESITILIKLPLQFPEKFLNFNVFIS